tara:strand:- start:3847 stop:4161 length:315 start_codon:yes stop_codon:yes gene_type:complete
MSPKFIMVFTTVSREREASKIANVCVEENLAACVQISKVESFYKWEGSKEKCDEYKIIFKTLSDNYFELEKKILSMHSYDLPSIYAVELSHINKSYADWIIESV